MPADQHGSLPASAEDLLRRRVKAELRKRLRGLRSALPESACAARSARIVLRLLSLEPIANARAVALFWPMERRHEVDLRPLDARLRERGVGVAYPCVDEHTRAMTFHFVTHPEEMKERALEGVGLCEPLPGESEVAPGELDVIVVPALAVDPRGQRIGYGAGYYDRTLPRFAPPATTIAVAFDFQLVAEVPVTEGDVAARFVVTDARTFEAT
jgi:5-formyltetrahydrofolate cyclo-ligase